MPLIFIVSTFFTGAFSNIESSKKVYNRALYFSAYYFVGSLLSLFFLKKSEAFFQSGFSIYLFSNTPLTFGVDYISMSLIILTNLFIYLCIFSLRSVEIRGKYSISELCNKLFFIHT